MKSEEKGEICRKLSISSYLSQFITGLQLSSITNRIFGATRLDFLHSLTTTYLDDENWREAASSQHPSVHSEAWNYVGMCTQQ